MLMAEIEALPRNDISCARGIPSPLDRGPSEAPLMRGSGESPIITPA